MTVHCPGCLGNHRGDCEVSGLFSTPDELRLRVNLLRPYRDAVRDLLRLCRAETEAAGADGVAVIPAAEIRLVIARHVMLGAVMEHGEMRGGA